MLKNIARVRSSLFCSSPCKCFATLSIRQQIHPQDQVLLSSQSLSFSAPHYITASDASLFLGTVVSRWRLLIENSRTTLKWRLLNISL